MSIIAELNKKERQCEMMRSRITNTKRTPSLVQNAHQIGLASGFLLVIDGS